VVDSHGAKNCTPPAPGTFVKGVHPFPDLTRLIIPGSHHTTEEFAWPGCIPLVNRSNAVGPEERIIAGLGFAVIYRTNLGTGAAPSANLHGHTNRDGAIFQTGHFIYDDIAVL
jgi:hypothetical protein